MVVVGVVAGGSNNTELEQLNDFKIKGVVAIQSNENQHDTFASIR